eukprot:361603-Chlamydomonas_euryale.AAC.17
MSAAAMTTHSLVLRHHSTWRTRRASRRNVSAPSCSTSVLSTSRSSFSPRSSTFSMFSIMMFFTCGEGRPGGQGHEFNLSKVALAHNSTHFQCVLGSCWAIARRMDAAWQRV